MSFKDATMRKAFPKEPKESEEIFKERKQEARIVSEPFCYDYAEKLLKEEDGLSNNQIREIILKITKKNKSYNTRFTFGNAQKLINMISKYLYIITLSDERMRLKFKNCDCPIDSNILAILKNNGQGFKISSWSKMDIENGEIPKIYIEVQDYIRKVTNDERDILYPIEFDYKYW